MDVPAVLFRFCRMAAVVAMVLPLFLNAKEVTRKHVVHKTILYCGGHMGMCPCSIVRMHYIRMK